jgi:hypothetical protein
MTSTTVSTRRNLLYLGVALNAFTIFKHTQIGFSRIFPRLDSALGTGDATAFAARMCYLIFSTGCFGTGEPPRMKKMKKKRKTGRNCEVDLTFFDSM